MSRKNVYNAMYVMAQAQNVLKDTHGNVSELTKEQTEKTGLWYDFCVKPSGIKVEDINSGQVCSYYTNNFQFLYDFAGLENELKPSVDKNHHLSIYERHPWIGGIAHTHSPYATSFAMRGSEIECYSTEQADYFGHKIRCLHYSDLDNWGNKVILKPYEKAILLQNHGVLTFGKDAKEAVKLAIALENIAEKTYLTLNLNVVVKPVPLPDEEIQKWHKRYTTVYGQKI